MLSDTSHSALSMPFLYQVDVSCCFPTDNCVKRGFRSHNVSHRMHELKTDITKQ